MPIRFGSSSMPSQTRCRWFLSADLAVTSAHGETPVSESFGSQIKSGRADLGISQARLAELVGVSATTIRRWERDESVPAGKHLTAIEAVLGLSTPIRISGPPDPTPPSADRDQRAPTRGPPSPSVPPEPPEPPATEEATETADVISTSTETSAELELDIGAGEAIEADPFPDVSVESATRSGPDPFPGSTVTLATPWISTDEPSVSFVDNPQEMLTYRIRWALTVAAVVGILLVVLWSFDQVGPAFDAILEPLRVFSG